MVRTLTAIVAAAAAFLAAYPASANEIKVLESSDREILVELLTDNFAVEPVSHGGVEFVRVRADGCDWTAEPGLPRLPTKSALIGVPFGAEVGLEIVSVEAERLGPQRVEPAPIEEVLRDGDFPIPVQRFEPDEAFYGSGEAYPAGVASLGFDATLRHQRTVQLFLHPFHYDPRDGLIVNRRIVVRLTLGPSRRPADMVAVGAVEREWEGIYAGTVLNYREASEWRMRPAPSAGRVGRASRPSEAYRLDVSETGIHRLNYSDLENAGFASLPAVADVAVYQRSFDRVAQDPFVETPLPVVVVDADSDGLFDAGDYVLFYARSFADEFLLNGWEDRYGTLNAYWFAVDPTLAARMDSRPAWHDWTGVTPPSSFRDTLRFEEDVYFDASPPADALDFYTWTFSIPDPPLTDDYRLPFSIHDIDPAGEVRLRARYHGGQASVHTVNVSIVDGASRENQVGVFQFEGITYTMASAIYQSGAISPSFFTDGANRLRVVGNRTGADLDWFEFAYSRDYAAADGRLAFTNGGASGEIQLGVSRFSTQAIRAFDVTDPVHPVELALGGNNVVPDGGEFRLVLQDSVGAFRRYEAVGDAGALAVAGVERRTPADLATREADFIVVSYEDFADEVAPLVARRESQGIVVTRALLQEVYDEFGGGMPSPNAIRAYFRYAFEQWTRPPQFALLVGDASEDTRRITSSSDPNFLPTYIHVSGPNNDLVASDVWYGCFSDDEPYLPQMYVGRLPVGNTGEAGAVVAKILAYENYQAGEAWRNNVFFLADDLWSYASLSADYTKKLYESEFTDVCMELADVVAASPAGIDTTVFALRRYTDPFHGSNTSGDLSYIIATQDFVRGSVTPELTAQLSDGAVIVNFQGHGNRTLMTHETLLQVRPSDDLALIENDGKPFIFMGYSCQLARFHYWAEHISGDCITERMLNNSSTRGAVAVFASTGIEYLSSNEIMNEKVFEAFFQDPTPEGPPEEYFWPRWSLGGMLAKAVVKYQTVGRPSSPARTFVLLGDPLMRVDMSPPTVRVTVDGVARQSGDYLEATGGEEAVIVADIIDEVEIDPATIEVVETDVGTVDPADYEVRAIVDSLAEQSRWYRVTYRAPIRYAAYDIRIAATDVNGQTTTFVLRVAEGQEIVIRDVANHPNPFTDRTTIIYLLSQSGSGVRVSIYTVGGRLIRIFEDAPSELSYNALDWDGRDAEGDEVANGVYLYVIEAEASDGSKATTSVGRMLKAK
jgi:hypothetical protein